MRWYHSIITKISLIFFFALLGVFAILYAFINYQTKRDLQDAEQFALFAIHSSFNPKERSLDLEKLKNNGLLLVENPKMQKKILSKRHFFRSHQKHISRIQRDMGLYIRPIIFEKKIYITVRERGRKIMLFQTPLEKETFSPLMVSIFSIIFVILLYIFTIKNILPLYTLKKKIKEFAEGNYDINCASNNKDEIGILSNEFNDAVKKIKSLRDSRQLFLRNIMHELKTPIAKGKFATEMAQDEDLKSTLQNIFDRQEYLIEEFARIEKLNANELQLDIKEYLFEDIVDFAQDILNYDDSHIKKEISPLKLSVDFELFGTALKNLLDNGIKYSDDSLVHISNNSEKITITSKGSELEFPLKNYAQPYFLKGTKQKNSRGLGFGLYIILHTIKLHNMKIVYKKELNKNTFEILLK